MRSRLYSRITRNQWGYILCGLMVIGAVVAKLVFASAPIIP